MAAAVLRKPIQAKRTLAIAGSLSFHAFLYTRSGTAPIMKLNVRKILAVINATYAVAKRKPEKIRLAGMINMINMHKLR